MKFTLYRDRNKQWRWRLKSRNGRIVANCGEGYRRKADCRKAIFAMRLFVATARFEELWDNERFVAWQIHNW